MARHGVHHALPLAQVVVSSRRTGPLQGDSKLRLPKASVAHAAFVFNLTMGVTEPPVSAFWSYYDLRRRDLAGFMPALYDGEAGNHTMIVDAAVPLVFGSAMIIYGLWLFSQCPHRGAEEEIGYALCMFGWITFGATAFVLTRKPMGLTRSAIVCGAATAIGIVLIHCALEVWRILRERAK